MKDEWPGAIVPQCFSLRDRGSVALLAAHSLLFSSVPARAILLAFFPVICYHEVRTAIIRGDDAMGERSSRAGEDRFMILENKAAQIRKLLFGSVLLAKDAWKEELLSSPEGLEVMRTVEEAEEEFMDHSLTDPVARLDRSLSVINTRARAFVMLIDYLARHKQK